MKNDSSHGKKLDALLKELAGKTTPELVELDPIVQIVVGFLEWNASAKSAAGAHDQMMGELVDNNDLRVSLPQELLPRSRLNQLGQRRAPQQSASSWISWTIRETIGRVCVRVGVCNARS